MANKLVENWDIHNGVCVAPSIRDWPSFQMVLRCLPSEARLSQVFATQASVSVVIVYQTNSHIKCYIHFAHFSYTCRWNQSQSLSQHDLIAHRMNYISVLFDSLSIDFASHEYRFVCWNTLETIPESAIFSYQHLFMWQKDHLPIEGFTTMIMLYDLCIYML